MGEESHCLIKGVHVRDTEDGKKKAPSQSYYEKLFFLFSLSFSFLFFSFLFFFIIEQSLIGFLTSGMAWHGTHISLKLQSPRVFDPLLFECSSASSLNSLLLLWNKRSGAEEKRKLRPEG